MLILNMIGEEIKKLLEKSLLELQKEKAINFLPEVELEVPLLPSHGDYSTNLALQIGKKERKDPLAIANLILAKLKGERKNLLERIEVLRPGFINFFLSQKALLRELEEILKKKEKYGRGKSKKIIVIDYSSPNIARPFGVGHLRSTIIGQAIYNIYKFLGWKCIGDNHLGDWGTQFGKLIFAIKKWGGKKKVSQFSVSELEKLYVKFHKEAEKYPTLEEKGREWFKKLEKGDKEAEKIWKACVKISLKEFKKIYKLLGIKIDYALGESFYRPLLKKIVREVKRKGIVKKSQGALIIDFAKGKLPPLILLKSDGTTTYLTRDLATLKYRLKKWKPDIVLYEVGKEQTLYLKQVFKIAEMLGWRKKEKFIHIAHGLIRLKEGKMSTRKGRTIHLEEISKEALKRARKIIENSKTAPRFSEREKEKLAKIVGIGAVKYNDLSQHYSKDILFDWEKMLNLRGNSAPYLQYTFARCQSILRKGRKWKIVKKIQLEREELEILKTLSRFPEIVRKSAQLFSPNLIANYIFQLAQEYNLFYSRFPIIKAGEKEKRDFRLSLTKAVAIVIKNSLSLLGIEAPKKM